MEDYWFTYYFSAVLSMSSSGNPHNAIMFVVFTQNSLDLVRTVNPI